MLFFSMMPYNFFTTLWCQHQIGCYFLVSKQWYALHILYIFSQFCMAWLLFGDFLSWFVSIIWLLFTYILTSLLCHVTHRQMTHGTHFKCILLRGSLSQRYSSSLYKLRSVQNTGTCYTAEVFIFIIQIKLCAEYRNMLPSRSVHLHYTN